MFRFIVITFGILLAGCQTNSLITFGDVYSADAETESEEGRFYPAETSNQEEIKTSLMHAIDLIQISYGNEYKDAGIDETKVRRKVTEDLAKMGYNVLYYHPPYLSSFRTDLFRTGKFPNIFVLGKKHTHEITLLFTGTEIGFDNRDLLQDLKPKAYGDLYPERYESNYYYIPNGHGGFRGGIFNLIDRQFFGASTQSYYECTEPDSQTDTPFSKTPTLKDFVCKYEIQNPDKLNKPLEVNVLGHSLGAGIAQVSLATISGIYWNTDSEDRDIFTHLKKNEQWPLALKGAYLFAPPLALYSHEGNINKNECTPIDLFNNPPIKGYQWKDSKSRWEPDPIEVYSAFNISSKSVSVINDADFVPTIWSPVKARVHCNEGEHFGRSVLIDRDGNAKFGTFIRWRFPEPHKASSYAVAIKNMITDE